MSLAVLDTAFDHNTWLEQHAHALDKSDPDRTFRYVLRNHPLHGCSFLLPIMTSVEVFRLSLQNAAKFADAVTVFCCDYLGYHQLDEICSEHHISEINDTHVGNLAYIAVNHCDPQIRQLATNKFERLRAKFAV